MPVDSGEKVGVPTIDAVAPGSAMLGDWSGDCSASVDLLQCSAIIGGRSGVEASSWRSIGSSAGCGMWMSNGLLGRDSVEALDRVTVRSSARLSTGVNGGVIGSLGSVWLVKDCLRGRNLSDEEREGGALRTAG